MHQNKSNIRHAFLNKPFQFNQIASYKLHILFWAAFIFWEVIANLAMFETGKQMFYIIFLVFGIGLFYFHAYWLNKILEQNQSLAWKIPILIATDFLLYFLLSYAVIRFLFSFTDLLSHAPIYTLGKRQSISMLWRASYFIIHSTGFCFIKRYLAERVELENTERQKLELELQKEVLAKELAISKNEFMKAQVSPHLLFNVLELLHQRVKTYSIASSELILDLSETMRFIASGNEHHQKIFLEKEIVHCESMLNLHRINGRSFCLDIVYAANVANVKIVPFILLSVLDNILKHGSLYNEDRRASLSIYFDRDALYIESVNQIKSLPNLLKQNGGLHTIKKRLEHTYGKNATLIYGIKAEDYFVLEIRIEKSVLNDFDSSAEMKYAFTENEN
ncbi:histidine kinase [Pedobacter sp. AW1-32]|uniref:histidine kinase n=1 Tax=Pedobacter sp. AW1-32 TaxID=3383026 RepID=UPI003FF06131